MWIDKSGCRHYSATDEGREYVDAMCNEAERQQQEEGAPMSQKQMHSPTPWECVEGEVHDASGAVVCDPHPFDAGHIVRCVNAAPALLAALREAERFIASLNGRVSLGVWCDSYNAAKAARAAIASADGA